MILKIYNSRKDAYNYFGDVLWVSEIQQPIFKMDNGMWLFYYMQPRIKVGTPLEELNLEELVNNHSFVPHTPDYLYFDEPIVSKDKMWATILEVHFKDGSFKFIVTDHIESSLRESQLHINYTDITINNGRIHRAD